MKPGPGAPNRMAIRIEPAKSGTSEYARNGKGNNRAIEYIRLSFRPDRYLCANQLKIAEIRRTDIHNCMHWRAINFDWNQARAFLATAEEGSLSAAARALGLTQPTLGRQVSALEDRLGVVLFERDGRGLVLTQTGSELLEHLRVMGEAAERLSLCASGQSKEIEGHVSITASDVFSAVQLPPILKKLHRIAPGIDVEIVASNEVRDLKRREADIAIRHVRPETPDLIAKKLGDFAGHFYAATEYLNRVGRPVSTEEFGELDLIAFDPRERMIRHLADMGLTFTLKNIHHSSESGLVVWALAKEGLGVTPMSERIGDATPGMERVMPELPSMTIPAWLVTHRELRVSRRIRLVFDFLAAELKSA